MTRPIAHGFGRFAALTAALMIFGVVLIGCGGGDDETTSDSGNDAFQPQVITDDDIAAQEAGSPGRALLEWWQAVQFQDATTAVDLTSNDALEELGKGDFEELVKTRGQGFQGVEVLDTTESGDTASVRAGLLTFQPEEEGAPPPDEPTSSRPATFEMEKDGDDWLYNTPAFLEPMIESMKQAEKEQESSGDEGSSGEGTTTTTTTDEG